MKAAAYLIGGMIAGAGSFLLGMESKTNFSKGYNEIAGKGEGRKTVTDILLDKFGRPSSNDEEDEEEFEE